MAVTDNNTFLSLQIGCDSIENIDRQVNKLFIRYWRLDQTKNK